VHPVPATLTEVENIVHGDDLSPESLQVVSKLLQIVASPLIEMEAYRPYTDWQFSKPPYLLRDPHRALFV
jgi:hypothetical protein